MVGQSRATPPVKRLTPSLTSQDAWGWLALTGLLVGYALIALTHLQGFRWNFDEGIALSQAWLLVDGYSLYDPIWTDHTPGQPILISLAFRWLGIHINVARSLSVVLALVGLLAVTWAVRELVLDMGIDDTTAWLAALLAALTLSIAPNFWAMSRAAMKVVPMTALGSLAMALALRYSRHRGRRWLALAGLALGVSLWIKLQMIYLGLLLGIVVLWRRRADLRRRVLATVLMDLLVLALTSLGPLLLCFLIFDPRAFWEQTFGTYLSTRAYYEPDLVDNLQIAWTWLSVDHGGLAALGLAGAYGLLRRPTTAGVTTLGWLALTLITPLQHAPLYIQHHFLPLLFGLVVCGGVALGQLVAWARQLPRPRPGVTIWLAGLAALVYLLCLPHVLTVDQALSVAWNYHYDGDAPALTPDRWDMLVNESGKTQAAIAFLQANSRPDQFVLIDEPILAFYAGRRLPPELAAISSRNVHIGVIISPRLIELTERYQPPVVITWRGLLWDRTAFRSWLQGTYTTAIEFKNEEGEQFGFVLRSEDK